MRRGGGGGGVPLLVRRTTRCLATFLTGLLLTSLTVDLLKVMTSRLRPHFITLCYHGNVTCSSSTGTGPPLLSQDTACTYTPLPTSADWRVWRQARMSFPSYQTAYAIYSAVFSAVYIECTLRVHGMRVVKPVIIITLIILSLMVSTNRYNDGYNHAEDIIISIILATLIALYMCLLSCNRFHEQSHHHHLIAKESSQPNTITSHANDQEDDTKNNNTDNLEDADMLFPSWLKFFKIPRVRNPSGHSTSSIQMVSPNRYQHVMAEKDQPPHQFMQHHRDNQIHESQQRPDHIDGEDNIPEHSNDNETTLAEAVELDILASCSSAFVNDGQHPPYLQHEQQQQYQMQQPSRQHYSHMRDVGGITRQQHEPFSESLLARKISESFKRRHSQQPVE